MFEEFVRWRNVEIKDYPVGTGELQVVATVNTSAIAHSLEVPEDLARIFDSTNSSDLSFSNGREMGRLLRQSHMGRHGAYVAFLLGALVGLGENETTIDPRNERAVKVAKAVTEFILTSPLLEDLAYALKNLRKLPAYVRDNYISFDNW